jgi:peptidoglycan hydrolase-like protein with peptidoglycan-binding domain
MPITLSRSFSRDTNVEPDDVQHLKKALNRLGYYQPNARTGITSIADAAVFDALKSFQRDHALPITGSAKPDDDTIAALNRESQKTPEGIYIWRTVEDNKVRKGHAAFNRTIRRWDDSPDPGEDFNCRCWAEAIDVKKIPIVNHSKERIESILNDTPAIFKIEVDKNVNDKAPWYEYTSLARIALAVNKNEINIYAKKHNLDIDLIRTVMWAENTRGGVFGLGYIADWIGRSKTVMPMNINPDIWHSLISENKNDLYKTEKNIESATILLKRIQERIISPTPEKIAAIWQYIGHEKINNYSAYIGRIYLEKPWLENEKDK